MYLRQSNLLLFTLIIVNNYCTEINSSQTPSPSFLRHFSLRSKVQPKIQPAGTICSWDQMIIGNYLEGCISQAEKLVAALQALRQPHSSIPVLPPLRQKSKKSLKVSNKNPTKRAVSVNIIDDSRISRKMAREIFDHLETIQSHVTHSLNSVLELQNHPYFRPRANSFGL